MRVLFLRAKSHHDLFASLFLSMILNHVFQKNTYKLVRLSLSREYSPPPRLLVAIEKYTPYRHSYDDYRFHCFFASI